MYTVQEVANNAHITVKTLHHYHKIGLLIPEQTTEAGYRLYGRKDLERLQQILFYKELDFPLKEIKQLLDGKVDWEKTLMSQKQLLLQKITRFNRLVETINVSIDSAEKGVELEMEKMFKGFETEQEWEQALQEQNEYLKNEYDVDLSDEFHRNMLEQQQIGYAYYLNKAAVCYLSNHQ
ncbi:MerR family transcriptional regulator [Bacillus sp. DNRA2]|uniref:MerR family transcriptional regulator n=1 Tax=Bacillus sp. DNRA2 TaxID=2723053 RepID=UPI00145FB72F|nr:MerR family transcriptional regulator [Bacillus sp. DNRA2]NMD72831.1 MerR family transcriptional regulator [Bacillus sp. DNRA2]